MFLVRERRLELCAWIISPDQSVKILDLRKFAPLLNSGTGKSVLWQALASLCRIQSAPGFTFASDCWLLDHTPEQLKRFKTDEKYGEEFRRSLVEEGVPETAAAGFGKLYEGVLAQSQTEHDVVIMQQKYERVGRGGSVITGTAVLNGALPSMNEHSIRFVGESEVLTSDEGEMSGRSMTLYQNRSKSSRVQ